MKRSILSTVAVALFAIVAAGAIGSYAYRAGVAQGLAEAGKLPSLAVAPYGYYPFWHGPFFFGGPLLFLLFFFLFFGLLRRVFWSGRWSHTHGAWGSGVPPRFEEWHRQAHESMEKGSARV